MESIEMTVYWDHAISISVERMEIEIVLQFKVYTQITMQVFVVNMVKIYVDAKVEFLKDKWVKHT